MFFDYLCHYYYLMFLLFLKYLCNNVRSVAIVWILRVFRNISLIIACELKTVCFLIYRDMKNAVIGNNKQKANLIVLGAVPRYKQSLCLFFVPTLSGNLPIHRAVWQVGNFRGYFYMRS